MKTRLHTLFCSLFLLPAAFGQNSLFLKTLGETAGTEEMEVVLETADGNIFVAGMTSSFGAGDDEGLVLKTDLNGTVLWAKTYGSSGNDMFIDAKQTQDGGYIVAGWTESFGASGYDCWVVKLDSDGDLVWEKRYGGSGDEQAWSINETSTGYFMVAGTNSFGAGLTDIWVLDLDATGNINWQKTYGSTGDDAPPGPYVEYVARGFVDTDGDYMISGLTDGMGAGGFDIWLAKLNPANGNIIWENAYGDTDDEAFWNIVENPSGGYYLPGNITNPSNGYEPDLWVVQLDTDGNINWQKSFGIADVWDEALNAATLSNGDLLLASYYESDEWDWSASTMKVDASGNLGWANIYKTGQLDWTNAVTALSDGTIAHVGVTTYDTISWDDDFLFIRTDEMGEVGTCDEITAFVPDVITTSAVKTSTSAAVTTTSVSGVTTTSTQGNPTLIEDVYCDEPVSIAENGALSFVTVYPNPANDFVMVQYYMQEAGALKLELTDVNGRQISVYKTEKNSGLWEERYPLDNLAAGVYYLRLSTSNSIVTQKVVLRP